MSRPSTPLHHPASSTSYPLPSGPPGIPKSSIDPTFSSPPRSNTHHHHKPSRPHLPHQPHRTHRHHHNRTDSSQQVPQSAIVGPSHNPFGDFLTKTKSSLADPFPSSASTLVGLGGTRTPPRAGDAATAASTTAASTAGSLGPGAGERDYNNSNTVNTNTQTKEEQEQRSKRLAAETQARQQQKWSRVSTLRRQRAEAEDDLTSTLVQLSTLSTTTTRRLDYTYYGLLSSLAGLRSGIGSLHSLARETRALQDKFQAQTRDVKSETEGVVHGAEEQFRRQAGRIEGLEERLRVGRETVNGLSGRLDGVRAKVEAAIQKDGEGRRRVRGFWRMGYRCVVALITVIVVGWIWQQRGDMESLVGMGGRIVKNGSASFWDLPMREGTLGAEDLKAGLKGLRGPPSPPPPPAALSNDSSSSSSSSSSSQLADKREDDTNHDNDDDDEVREAGEAQTRRKNKVDTEATLRLFDEL